MADDRRVIWREAALVVVAAAIQIGVPLILANHRPELGELPPGGVALLALGVAAIPLRLRWPIAALLVAFGATLAYAALGFTEGPIFVGLIVTFGHAVLTDHRRWAFGVAVAGFVGFSWLGPALGNDDPPGAANVAALAAWLLVLSTGFELLRVRRVRAAEAEAAQADALQRQIAEERLAIARDLHDVVAHNMSLINLQAGVALHLGDGVPDASRDALETIRVASKEALVELRSILGVLRHVDATDDGVPSAPVPGLAIVDDLAGRVRSAGVEVSTRIDVDPATLPRPVDVAAYRIIQESLTNVARHAHPPTATVDVRIADGALLVSVADRGEHRRPSEALPSGGNGLPGMRERAASVGGTLVAGRRPGEGFVVDARLPLDGGDGR